MNGSPDAITRLFDAHADRLYRLARRLSPSADDALDLVQETFLRAARARASIPVGIPTEEEAWLVRVLVNIRRDQWRRDKVRHQRNGLLGRPAEARQDTEGAYVARADVWAALDTLSPRRRAIVVMHELEGLSTTAIASLLGVTTITVRWHLSRGRRELARRLGVEGERDEQSENAVAGRRPARSRSTGA